MHALLNGNENANPDARVFYIKIKKARMCVKIAPKTREQPIANVPHHVTLAVRARQHQTEACLVRNVWPANLKKRQTRTKTFVPLVHRAITRTRQT